MGREDLYLDLMIESLTNFGNDDFVLWTPARGPLKSLVWGALAPMLRTRRLEIVRRTPFDAEKRMLGRDWPISAVTMIGVKRLKNICECVRTVLDENVPGDLIETGVWRGGGSIMMKATLEVFGDKNRTVWCADSFEGLPAPELDRYPQDQGMTWHTQSILAVTLDQVRKNFQRYGLLDDRVRFLKGWFKDTLPCAPIESIAVLRLDGDLYSSTMDALNSLYSKVSVGGFVIVDDYGIPEDTCRRAVVDFRASHRITTPLTDIDGWGKFWRRES